MFKEPKPENHLKEMAVYFSDIRFEEEPELWLEKSSPQTAKSITEDKKYSFKSKEDYYEGSLEIIERFHQTLEKCYFNYGNPTAYRYMLELEEKMRELEKEYNKYTQKRFLNIIKDPQEAYKNNYGI